MDADWKGVGCDYLSATRYEASYAGRFFWTGGLSSSVGDVPVDCRHVSVKDRWHRGELIYCRLASVEPLLLSFCIGGASFIVGGVDMRIFGYHSLSVK
ncbi:hypothetical protein AMTR_s00017p00107340 [Amborella trichopoda]|uniref:Uncharacterized protein n=1 Tax=Amborella trichopoda TaxID=13333 RepID=W1PKJ4_AMBTC|nr:hypothetical protein AMTR_s00017p00107340 [Amborella trichopoda]